MKIRLAIAASAPPEAQPAAKIQTRNMRKVMWILIAVPAIEPMFTDHSMAVLQQPNAYCARHRYDGRGSLARGGGGFKGGDRAARRCRRRIGLASIPRP